jgi:hypothetical protein
VSVTGTLVMESLAVDAVLETPLTVTRISRIAVWAGEDGQLSALDVDGFHLW